MNDFRIAAIPPLTTCPEMDLFGDTQALETIASHRSFADLYAPTPLRRLAALAETLGLGGVYLKDESYRFGLNAFKALGGSYAIGRHLAETLGIAPQNMTLDRLTAPDVKRQLGEITFCTATDGNHGRGVAWTARVLQQKCVVYMPKGSAQERVSNIRAQGATVIVTDVPYDDTVRLARETAQKNGWITVQDTAWEGYTDIPLHIMQGYLTMAYEAYRQLDDIKPTHIFLQAGVGSMAGAVAALFKNLLGKDAPTIVIVEPHAADCHFRSAAAGDGSIQITPGDLNTIMAGLACGEPNPISWSLMRTSAHYCLSVPEYAAADGMRVLASPIGNDPRVTSGESGASAFGAVYELMARNELSSLREQIGLNKQSQVLLFSTEGATDRENYRKVVWEGSFPAPQRQEQR